MFNSSVVWAILVRPYLWPTTVRAMFEFAPRRWWARPPFVPIPDATVMEWRVTTAYGHGDMTLAATDVVSYLRWRRAA